MYILLHIYANLWLKIWAVKKIWELFLHLKNWHLMAQQMANQWHILKSKPRYVEHPRAHLRTDY